MSRWRMGASLITMVLLSATAGEGQLTSRAERVFDEQVLRPDGQPVIPIFEGYYENSNGTYEICFGYFNLNTGQDLDVPFGPDNFIEPREFDGGQPTHFDRVPAGNYRRHLCVFTINVPADFGDREVVWTINTDGEPISSPGKVLPSYVLNEPASPGRGDVAPVLKFERNGTEFQGRTGFTGERRTVSVGDPLTLTAWVDHPDDRVWVAWTQHQGPGRVDFAQSEIQVDMADGIATTTATFADPGDYLIRVQSINNTDAFEFHCCWTNGYIQVRVTQ
jgi:hypothetical protein